MYDEVKRELKENILKSYIKTFEDLGYDRGYFPIKVELTILDSNFIDKVENITLIDNKESYYCEFCGDNTIHFCDPHKVGKDGRMDIPVCIDCWKKLVIDK